MLAEAGGVKKIIIACGRTDLRKGIDGLVQLIGTKYMFKKHTLNELNNMSREDLLTIILTMQGQLDTLNDNIEKLIGQVRLANQQMDNCPKKGHKKPSKLQKQVWRVSVKSFGHRKIAHHAPFFYMVGVAINLHNLQKETEPINCNSFYKFIGSASARLALN